MFGNRFLLLLAFLAVLNAANAEDFIVASNADNGPGSLRQALKDAAANGDTSLDHIYFNLPDQSEAGRTITLLSELPAVSSNLSIDASTQPGTFFGVSTARVQLLAPSFSQETYSSLLLFDVHDVEIYALYIRALLPNPPNSVWKGINIRSCKNITIGGAGKGNVIVGFRADIDTNPQDGGQLKYYSRDLSLKANFISVAADGVTVPAQPTGIEIKYVYGEVVIGGTPDEGNLLPAGISITQANTSNSADPADLLYTLPATIRISNNKIGVDYYVMSGIAASSGIHILTHTPNGKNTVTIEDNVISSQKSNGIYIINNGPVVNIRRNFLGTDKTRSRKLPMIGTAIFIYYASAMIGGSDPADANYITGCKPVDVWPYSTVAVNKNSFYCTVNAYPMIFDTYGTKPFPVVKILGVTANSVTGTATPNSAVELFYSDQCGTCSPETYFGSATADAAGKWTYTGPVSGSVIASATLNGATSEFTRTSIAADKAVVVNACNGTGGSITGIIPESARDIAWLNESGDVVGTSADLINVPPGKYRLQATNGDCNVLSAYFEIKNSLGEINTQNLVKKDPSCGMSNGSVSGITVINHTQNTVTYSWKDAGGVSWGNSADLLNVPAGAYTLNVSLQGNPCVYTYGPVILQNTTGPNVDQSALVVTPSLCGSSSGSIVNIKASGTGTLKYSWQTVEGVEVATTRDLVNQPAGSYKLFVYDQSSCGAVSTSEIIIGELNGITISDNGTAKESGCQKSDGAITGITVSGATIFKWFNSSSNTVIATTAGADISGLPPGSYYLVASNAYCSRTSKTYRIDNHVNTESYVVAQTVIIEPACGLSNGSLSVSLSGVVPKGLRWIKQGFGDLSSTGTQLTGIDKGIYSLYGMDEFGCEKLIADFSVDHKPELVVDVSRVKVSDDNCETSTGSITGINVSGTAPFIFKWSDKSGKVLGSAVDLSNIAAGIYRLDVSDASSCQKTVTYTVGNRSDIVPKPQVPDVHVCELSDAQIAVSSPGKQFTYRLYDSMNALVPVDQQPSGLFKIVITSNRSFYVSQVLGICESQRQEVKVSVGTTGLSIPNAFTPNGDGINDNWEIKGISNYPGAKIQVFNRSGQKVFDSLSNAEYFNGTYLGKALPAGSYYYKIDVGTLCGTAGGSVTILR